MAGKHSQPGSPLGVVEVRFLPSALSGVVGVGVQVAAYAALGSEASVVHPALTLGVAMNRLNDMVNQILTVNQRLAEEIDEEVDSEDD